MLNAPVKKYYAPALLSALLTCAVMLVVGAAQVSAIARGYTTDDEGLSAGMVAALTETGDTGVERADQSNAKRIVGIVTTFEGSSVTLASGDSKVLVENEGHVDAYISDIGGKVTKGDLLTLSSFKGILMKADGNTTEVIVGVAAQDSDSVSPDSFTHYSYIDNGSSKTTEIIKIRVNLNKQSITSAATTPSPLSRIGESITGKQVSDIRVLAALVIFLLVMIAEGGIIYGAVTSSITALGRNPMARKIIRREMTRVMVVAICVLSLGLGAVYGVLWY